MTREEIRTRETMTDYNKKTEDYDEEEMWWVTLYCLMKREYFSNIFSRNADNMLEVQRETL